MSAVVGKGIRDRMAEMNDTPVTHEWTERHGQSRQAKAWGHYGLYVASKDDGGEWKCVGPFVVGE